MFFHKFFLLNFSVLLVVCISSTASQFLRPRDNKPKALGRGCKISNGEISSQCGENAQCFEVPLGSERSGHGVCACKSKAFKEPASMPQRERDQFKAEMGERFWTDCIPLIKIGDPCPSGSSSGRGRGRGNYYYYYYDSQPSSTGQGLLPEDSQCGFDGTVQCKPGRVQKGEVTCAPQSQGGSATFGEQCSNAFCDSSLGLRCLNGESGAPLCACNGGSWLDGKCSSTPTHGDRCQNDNDCQPRGSQSRLLARMRCRQTASYYFSNSVDTCQCATVINGGYDALGAYVVPNRQITVATGHNTSASTYVTIPVRLNDTGSEDMPVSYWCLDRGAQTYQPQPYLAHCDLSLANKGANDDFRICADGLACMYFPVSEEDKLTVGRCVPLDRKDERWYGSEGPRGGDFFGITNNLDNQFNNGQYDSANGNGYYNNNGYNGNSGYYDSSSNIKSASGRSASSVVASFLGPMLFTYSVRLYY